MKIIKIAIFLTLVFSCATAQNKYQFIIGDTHILTNSQYSELNNRYSNHNKKTNNHIVLYTIDDFHPCDSLRQYGISFFNEVGIGEKKKNNGVLILFCKKCHKIEIILGIGVEKVMSNEIVKSFINENMIPQFKQGKYFEGLLNGSQRIITYLEEPEHLIK